MGNHNNSCAEIVDMFKQINNIFTCIRDQGYQSVHQQLVQLGDLTIARAIATRCCSPPDRSSGKSLAFSQLTNKV